MKKIVDLRNELLGVFNDLKDGSIDPKIASEMNNSAGKAIKTILAQLEYAALRQEKPDIDFMN
jgi:hypothetical protein